MKLALWCALLCVCGIPLLLNLLGSLFVLLGTACAAWFRRS